MYYYAHYVLCILYTLYAYNNTFTIIVMIFGELTPNSIFSRMPQFMHQNEANLIFNQI